MAVKFYPEEHKYVSVDPDLDIDWISVTTLLHHFKEPFDEIKMSELCSKGKNPKYKGKDPEEIRKVWKAENKRATTLGSWYHDMREKDLLSCSQVDGVKVVQPEESEGVKTAPDQKLTPGIYPEHFVYLLSKGVCGQADYVEVIDNVINIRDYKTNKEIKTEGFKGRNGSKKMLPPLNHLDDCNFNDYSLQLSMYMYIMLKHNKHLQPGYMQIEHIKFGVEELDENGYPITSLDAMGDPVVLDVIPYKVPYLKDEVEKILHIASKNKHLFKKH